jgi:hypothetical protein
VKVKKKLNDQGLIQSFKTNLARLGPLSAPEACQQLAVSQPVFSRLVAGLKGALLIVGKARATRYALRREIPKVGWSFPVYGVDENGKSYFGAILHGVAPKGFYLESKSEIFESRFYEDLPYFLSDLQPSGFLGRLIPGIHSELEVPSDIRLWSTDHCLQYLCRYGWNLVGNFILGKEAFNLFLKETQSPSEMIRWNEKEQKYPQYVEKVLQLGPAGSSVGGERPKFMVRVSKGSHLQQAMVKFSPPLVTAFDQRQADLLICEHIAHRVLNRHEVEACQSELLKIESRVFLEIERVDRNKENGRLGIVSLFALNAEFVGERGSWTQTAGALFEQGEINQKVFRSIRKAEAFGRLIANDDRHDGNLSFFIEGEQILALVPIYDMLPMLYFPRNNEIILKNFEPDFPEADDASVWREAWLAAIDFWKEVASHSLVSSDFKKIADENLKKLESMKEIYRLLPVS